MKRIFALLTALMLLCPLTACGQPEVSSAPDSSEPAQKESSSESESSSSLMDVSQPETDEEESRVLVAYFSATGNTENIALHLRDILDADLYEIVPEEPYTDADLNYSDDNCRANQEQNDPNARPAISGTPEHPEDYDVVFLGYPIWWGQAPKVMSTFLESCEFGDAVIVPFCTSGSSGIGSSAENLQSLAPAANWLTGQRFSGSADQEEVASWVESLDLLSDTNG